jgi:HK97 family phage portal protein
MNLRATFKSLWPRFGSIIHHPSSIIPVAKSFATAWLTGRENTLPGHSLLASAYEQSTWIYACISTLAETVSGIPFRIVDATSSEPIQNPKSEIVNLFDRPHPQLDRFQFWELIVIWLCLRGEAFVYPVSDSSASSIQNLKSKIQNLLVLCPDHLHEIIRSGELAGWRYSAASINYQPSTINPVLLPEELIHIRLPNPFNFWRGMSPLTVAWLAAQTDYAASQFMKGTMLNNADTGLIVTTDQQITAEQKEEVLAALRDRKRRAGTPDVPLFLFGGAKVDKPTISAVDLQFLQNRKFNRQEICAVFKVPQEVIGFTEDANRSVSESARLNFMENRIAPLCRRLEAAIQPVIDQVVGTDRRAVRVRGEFHIKSAPVMQAAQRSRIDSGEKLFSMGVPLNTVNTVLDLGLPKLPHGDTAYVPGKLTEVGPLGKVGPERAQELRREADPGDRCLQLLSALKTRSAGCQPAVPQAASLRRLINGHPRPENYEPNEH